jgi:hypothetical protein
MVRLMFDEFNSIDEIILTTNKEMLKNQTPRNRSNFIWFGYRDPSA